MRALLSVGVLAAALGVTAADDKKDPTIGRWTIESLTRDGKPDDRLKGAVRVHDGSKYTVTPPAGSTTGPIEGTYAVDSSKSPATIDMKPASGQYKDKTLSGIVKVEGDTLTIAFAEPGKDRPATFESKPGSGITVAVHRRAK